MDARPVAYQASALTLGVALLLTGAVHGQPPTPQPAPALAFEVASVKPNKSLSQDMNLNTPGGGLVMVNGSVRTLIKFAYDLRDFELSGGPSWLDTDHYDVAAKPPSDTPGSLRAGDPVRLRVQTLLAERFHLVVHQEGKEMAVLALVRAGSNAKLEPWKESDGPGPSMRSEYRKLTCRKYSMQMFASRILSERFGRPVIDKTGITGEFTFIMTFEPDRAPSTSPDAAPDAAGPTFLQALHDQLGLKLERQRGPVKITVIDRVERPDPN